MGNKKANVKVEEDKLSWLRETLEWQKDMQDPDEFLNTLKTELFEDEVYVFTPKGKIIALPKGSIPIDFAYYIHAEIGNHMTGAKINSKMMPIVTQLKNGDIVEIITSDQSKGPSRDWLKFIKSSTAKSKILAWFKKNDREENIVKGKDLIEKEIKKIGMTHAELAKPEYMQAALDRYKYSELDEMYASVGFGAISSGKIVARMLEEYKKDHQTENLDEKLEELSKGRAYKPKPSKTGIIVKGIDNCLVKLSKCCNPVPGDEIVGYITKGRGVSVHRKDCVNVNNLLSEENRMIDVYWYEAEKTRYSVDIEVYGNERSGLLADIIREIEGTKSKLLAVTSRANKEKISITEVTVE
ncbi:MAG: TGS domain-containing protein, partial [Clostridiales bacterium]